MDSDLDISDECVFESTVLNNRLWLVGNVGKKRHIKKVIMRGPISYGKGQLSVRYSRGGKHSTTNQSTRRWEDVPVPEAFEINLEEAKELRIDIDAIVEEFMIPFGNAAPFELRVIAVDTSAQYCGMGNRFSFDRKVAMLCDIHTEDKFVVENERTSTPQFLDPSAENIDEGIKLSVHQNVWFTEKQKRLSPKSHTTAFFDRAIQDAKLGKLDEQVYAIVCKTIDESGNAKLLKQLIEAFEVGQSAREASP